MVGHQPSILRANRSGGGVGTSPGINPIVPYTTAALDYRSSWIAGEMVAMTKATTHNQNAKTLTETIQNEARGMRNSETKPAKRRPLPPPTSRVRTTSWADGVSPLPCSSSRWAPRTFQPTSARRYATYWSRSFVTARGWRGEHVSW